MAVWGGGLLGSELAARERFGSKSLAVALVGGCALGVASLLRGPWWALAALGVAYATQFHAWIHADARIQERLESATRATATSVRELLSNLVSMGVLAGVGALSVGEDPTRGLLMMLAGVALVAAALAAWVPDRSSTTDARGESAARSERDAAADR